MDDTPTAETWKWNLTSFAPIPAEQHIYHHSDSGIKIATKIERNTKGYNWELTVSNAATLDEALSTLEAGRVKLAELYGEPV